MVSGKAEREKSLNSNKCVVTLLHHVIIYIYKLNYYHYSSYIYTDIIIVVLFFSSPSYSRTLLTPSHPPPPTGGVSGFRVGVVQGRRHPPHLAPAPRPRHRQQAAVPAVGGRHLHHAARLSSPEGNCHVLIGSLDHRHKKEREERKKQLGCWERCDTRSVTVRRPEVIRKTLWKLHSQLWGGKKVPALLHPSARPLPPANLLFLPARLSN